MSIPTSETRRKPGRPKDGEDMRDAILDQAEIAFAEAGFAGTKLRDIAGAAGVNQALIRYYFGTKEDLFDEVFRRRGGLISGARHVQLDQLLARGKPLQATEIIMAYLRPQWDMKHSGPNGAAFVKLQARLHAEPEEHALRLRREVYDASVKRYIQALSEALPDVPRPILSLRMAFLVGTYLFMLNDLGRLNDLTDGQIGEIDRESMLRALVAFLAAGLAAPVS
ncbi:TetR family transcriptional regulator [Nitratireductor indicus C115]|uniref:TetR family transcriptional regulator n=1 Tax=Nitratireductor indicus C115 TaxID=1231190 RepID=K2PM59_9HYPH|nr:TetR family transcriptional regulator [Nitratireductor indicus]EKF42152.1 TetR family transcriptional regulator [Nitratireductor indicus C115]SFQ61658.1 transcriptional regulator, TetR family [Nitratireductor indicus]